MTLDERTSIRLGLSLFSLQAVGSTATLMAAREDFGGKEFYMALFYVFTMILLCAIALNQALMRKILGWWSVVAVLSTVIAFFAGVEGYPPALTLFSDVCWGLAAWLLLIRAPRAAAGK